MGIRTVFNILGPLTKPEGAKKQMIGIADRTQGELLARLGEVEPDRSQRMDYLQRSLSLFRDLGAVGRMKEVQTSVHRAVMGR